MCSFLLFAGPQAAMLSLMQSDGPGDSMLRATGLLQQA